MSPQPLLEPALLVSENCETCRGTGVRDEVCGDCDGVGRRVREVPMSEVWEMAQRSHSQVTAPPPSMLREQGAGQSRA